MANIYRTTITDIINSVKEREDFISLYNAYLKRIYPKKECLLKIIEIVLDEIKKELIDSSTVSINKFGSFSLKLRTRGKYFIKFSQYKRIKEFIKNNINNNSLFNRISPSFEQIKIKVATNEISLEQLAEIVSLKITENEFNSEREFLLFVIITFFASIEEEVYKLKIVNIFNFGQFYLNVNKKFGIYFKFSTSKSFKTYINNEIIKDKK